MSENFHDMFEDDMRRNPSRIEAIRKEKRNTTPRIGNIVDLLLFTDIDTVGYLIDIVVERAKKRYAEAMFDIDRRPINGDTVNNGLYEIEFWKVLSQFETELPHPDLGKKVEMLPRGKEERNKLIRIFQQDKELGSYFPSTHVSKIPVNGEILNRIRSIFREAFGELRNLEGKIKFGSPDGLFVKSKGNWDVDAIEASIAYIDGFNNEGERSTYTGEVDQRIIGATSLPGLPVFLKFKVTTSYFIIVRDMGGSKEVECIGCTQNIKAVGKCIAHIEKLKLGGVEIKDEHTEYLKNLERYLALTI